MSSLENKISKTQFKRINEHLKDYARFIGLKVSARKRVSSSQLLIRICNKSEKINQAVRSEGGKVSEEQRFLLYQYMHDNPINPTFSDALRNSMYGREQIKTDRARRRKFQKLRTPTKVSRTSGIPTAAEKRNFYRSWDWRTTRFEILKEFGRKCMSCGVQPGQSSMSGDPVKICVDHIKPISKYWELRLNKENLQVLCEECNMGKGAWDETDFRPKCEPA